MFQRNAKLEMLGLSMPLSWTQSYHDDGYVTDLIEYIIQLRPDAKSLLPQVRRAWIMKYNECYKEQRGITITKERPGILLPDTEEVHIAYLDINPLFNTYVRGRQETKALENLGHLKMLEAKVGLSFSRVKSNRIADIGGIYALLKQNYRSDQIVNEGDNDMKMALNAIQSLAYKH